MYTFKGEHKFTDKSSLSGIYIYNKTDEPGSTIMKADKLFMADQDQWFGPLRRRPHVLVLNSTERDQQHDGAHRCATASARGRTRATAQPFSAGPAVARLQPDVRQRARSRRHRYVPVAGTSTNTEAVGGWGRSPVRWKGPYAINGALTKLCRHATASRSAATSGAWAWRWRASECQRRRSAAASSSTPQFTSRNGTGGNEVASLLLGLPYAGSVPHDPGETSSGTRNTGAPTSRTTGA